MLGERNTVKKPPPPKSASAAATIEDFPFIPILKLRLRLAGAGWVGVDALPCCSLSRATALGLSISFARAAC